MRDDDAASFLRTTTHGKHTDAGRRDRGEDSGHSGQSASGRDKLELGEPVAGGMSDLGLAVQAGPGPEAQFVA